MTASLCDLSCTFIIFPPPTLSRRRSDSFAIGLGGLERQAPSLAASATSGENAAGDVAGVLYEERGIPPYEWQPHGDAEEIVARVTPRSSMNTESLGRRSKDESDRVDNQARPGRAQEEDRHAYGENEGN